MAAAGVPADRREAARADAADAFLQLSRQAADRFAALLRALERY